MKACGLAAVLLIVLVAEPALGQSKTPQKPGGLTKAARPAAPPAASASTSTGSVTAVDAGSASLTVAPEAGAPLTFTIGAATKWKGVGGLAELLVGEVVTVSYRPTADSSGATAQTALAVAVDTARPDRPMVRQGTAKDSGMVVMAGGSFSPFLTLVEFPGINFICASEQAVKWKLIEDLGVAIVGLVGGPKPSLASVRLTTRRVDDRFERILDLQEITK